MGILGDAESLETMTAALDYAATKLERLVDQVFTRFEALSVTIPGITAKIEIAIPALPIKMRGADDMKAGGGKADGRKTKDG